MRLQFLLINKIFATEPIKYTEAPKLSKSMLIALEDIKLDRITVIYPGKKKFKIHEHILAVGLENYINE